MRSYIRWSFEFWYGDVLNRGSEEVAREEAYRGLCLIHRACLRVMTPGSGASEEALAAACRLLPRVEFMLDLVRFGTREEIKEMGWW